jgi:hypothetical protein
MPIHSKKSRNFSNRNDLEPVSNVMSPSDRGSELRSHKPNQVPYVRDYERWSDCFRAGACFGWCLPAGLGILLDFTVAAEFVKKAVDLTDADGLNGRSVQENVEMVLDYYRFVTDHSHPEATLNYSHCLRLLDRSEPVDALIDEGRLLELSYPAFQLSPV